MKGMEGGADLNADNKITAGELHSFVLEKSRKTVTIQTNP